MASWADASTVFSLEYIAQSNAPPSCPSAYNVGDHLPTGRLGGGGGLFCSVLDLELFYALVHSSGIA